MKPKNIKLLALHFIRNTIKSKSFYIVGIIFLLLTAFAAVSGIKNHVDQNTIRNTHQSKARQSWEANPDKHPHRMAHFGTFAFRISQPLSLFDYGLENYTGNAVFLEAHRQNSANFSEASFSTGILRFGELSMAMLLQLVLPLILIFIGFSGIAADRQNGTLKILLSQGASWFEILLGRSFGLFVISLLFFTPVVLTVVFALLNYGDVSTGNFIGLRFLILVLGYIIFLFIVTITIIVISALSTTTKNALLRLLGLWLLMVILLPKSAQDLGEYWFPTPSKLAFTSAIEKDVIKTGDSHNPNDPYYKHLKDSVLLANNVNEVTELPFNYAGLVMSEGEKISATLYKQHQDRLLKGYQNQNNISKLISYINPYMAIKQLSMITSGTDFSSYVDFQNQAEHYRYELAQRMNELQIKHISPKRVSGSEGKKHVIGHEHWEEFSDFRHKSISFDKMINEATGSIISLIMWLVVITGLLSFTAKRAKAI